MATGLKNINVQADGSYALQADTMCDARVLAANTAETFTLDENVSHVVFSATSDFYVRYTADDDESDNTATVPSSDVTDGTASELNPTVRYVQSINKISVIAPAACTVTLLQYRS